MDFSTLDNDQLLELLTATFAEAIQRGGLIADAAQAELLSAKERAEIEWRIAAEYRQKKEEEERNRIAKKAKDKIREEEFNKQISETSRNWASKASIVQAFREWGYEGDFSLNIWSRGADRRVYFEGLEGKKYWKWCLYFTGNQYNAPNSLKREGGNGGNGWFDDRQDKLKKLLNLIASHWKGDLRLSSSEAEEIEPNTEKLEKYREVLEIKEKTHT